MPKPGFHRGVPTRLKKIFNQQHTAYLLLVDKINIHMCKPKLPQKSLTKILQLRTVFQKISSDIHIIQSGVQQLF